MQEEYTSQSLTKFKTTFPDAHSLIVALHATSLQHAMKNAEIAFDNWAHGVAVVTHAIKPELGIMISSMIKDIFKTKKVLLNIRQREPKKIFKTLEQIKYLEIDGIRTDKAMIYGIDWIRHNEKNYADKVVELQKRINRKWLYFWWVDFKHQRPIPENELAWAVAQAKRYLDVITTSGVSTGISADSSKVQKIKLLAENHPVALASGVTPENIKDYIEHTDISIVATGISKDYRNLDPKKVAELAKTIGIYNRKIERKNFESETLKKYNMQSATELYNFFKTGEIINIGMHPDHDESQKKLSNLYPSPFILDDIEYASVEAFWMSIKYPENDPRRREIRTLSGIKAKLAGRDAKNFTSLYYQGKEIQIGSPEHHALMKRAIRAKLEQNPDILQTLLATWNKKLTHIVFTRHEHEKFILHDSKTIPWEIFAQIYTELRKEFPI